MDVTSLLDNLCQHPVDGGGSCDIYRGQLRDGPLVALKIDRLHRGSSESEDLGPQQSMRRMLNIWAKCHHPNVVQLIGGAMLQGGIAAVYEWREYGGIIEYLKHHSEADRYQLSARICEGVTYLHANDIIHNSLKGVSYALQHIPILTAGTHLLQSYVQTNILISSNGVPQIHLSLHTSTNSMEDGACDKISSPNIRWAAPELLLAESGGTFASDVYALGMETVTMAVPYAEQRDKQVVIKIMNQEFPSRPKDVIPDNHAGNLFWDALCACWSFDAAKRPNAGEILSVMSTICEPSDWIKSDSVHPEIAQHVSPVVHPVALRLVVTENTCIQDLVSYFEKRNLTNYTDVLMSTSIVTSMPFADTALANVYKINLPNQQCIAVKCVKHVTPHKKLKKKRAARELSCWLSHKHENILPVLGFAVVRGDLAMVSPWMANGCVTEYVVANPGCNRVKLCTQLARAITYLHEHDVVHGDIKGPNVLVSELGAVKITD
ncbi:unnamed protein product, partial [Rhizoctonia solani]